jgi:hypothetical protein
MNGFSISFKDEAEMMSFAATFIVDDRLNR